jgi:phospholipid/cholesterol/gamma-HCH transport system permease protein
LLASVDSGACIVAALAASLAYPTIQPRAMSSEATVPSPVLTYSPATDARDVRCAGAWTVRTIADVEPRLARVPWPATGEVAIDASGVSPLDTTGAWLLHRTVRELEARGCTARLVGLRPEFASLLELIASREIPLASPAPPVPGRLERLGRHAWANVTGSAGYLAFVGESAIAMLCALRHPQRLRWRPILHNVQTAGVEALPITGLLSFLMGVVIAYQGADQLQRFGANIFVVDLVSLAMLRELSPLLTAIIIAGRSGSAYTAQIGTMKVTEEIDALRTIGVGAQELLVLPKVIALIIVMPLLTVYTDVTGVLGGMVMARLKLDVGFDVFVDRLDEAVQLSSYWTGLAKAPVFAMIIALVGCYRGFQVTGSAESVGAQTTMSVVQSIFLVIVTDAIFSIVFLWLDL